MAEAATNPSGLQEGGAVAAAVVEPVVVQTLAPTVVAPAHTARQGTHDAQHTTATTEAFAAANPSLATLAQVTHELAGRSVPARRFVFWLFVALAAFTALILWVFAQTPNAYPHRHVVYRALAGNLALPVWGWFTIRALRERKAWLFYAGWGAASLTFLGLWWLFSGPPPAAVAGVVLVALLAHQALWHGWASLVWRLDLRPAFWLKTGVLGIVVAVALVTLVLLFLQSQGWL